MSIDVVCTVCGHCLDAPGAIVISPPIKECGETRWEKLHICIECWDTFGIWVSNGGCWGCH